MFRRFGKIIDLGRPDGTAPSRGRKTPSVNFGILAPLHMRVFPFYFFPDSCQIAHRVFFPAPTFPQGFYPSHPLIS